MPISDAMEGTLMIRRFALAMEGVDVLQIQTKKQYFPIQRIVLVPIHAIVHASETQTMFPITWAMIASFRCATEDLQMTKEFALRVVRAPVPEFVLV